MWHSSAEQLIAIEREAAALIPLLTTLNQKYKHNLFPPNTRTLLCQISRHSFHTRLTPQALQGTLSQLRQLILRLLSTLKASKSPLSIEEHTRSWRTLVDVVNKMQRRMNELDSVFYWRIGDGYGVGLVPRKVVKQAVDGRRLVEIQTVAHGLLWEVRYVVKTERDSLREENEGK